MQFVDLKAQYQAIEHSVRERINKVLEHGQYILGPEVAELEEKLAKYCNTKHCISCSSGTDALLLGLMANNVGPGDAIFTSVFTFFASAEVISFLGATPVFVDIRNDTFNINPELLEESIKKAREERKNPKGIIPVNLFGLPADYDEINQIAEKYGLFVLEDAAQSFGAECKGRKSCNLAPIAATSFFPAKPLGCYGDGGAVFTNDDKIAETLLSLRVHGQGSDKYENVRIGLNGRLDTIQAAVLLCKLDIFEEEINARQKAANYYSEHLSNICSVPAIPPGYKSAWAQYSILSDRRDEVINELKLKNIPTAIYYPNPLHLQQAFRSLRYNEGDFPVAEEVSKKIMSLPMHPYLDEEGIKHIINKIKGTYVD